MTGRSRFAALPRSVTWTLVKVTALIGYARVSKADGSQVIDLQHDALAKAGVDLEHHLYTDAASGKRDDRPGLEACIKALRRGDTLVVWKLDRLGRDLRHLVNLVGDLTKRDIGLKVLAGEGASIDTTTANGRLIFAIFAGQNDFATKNPDLIQNFGRAIRDATVFTNAHHAETLDLYAAFAHIDPKDIADAPRSTSVEYVDPKDLAPLINVAVRYNIIKPVDPLTLLSPAILKPGA